jgi:hypothetical protein
MILALLACAPGLSPDDLPVIKTASPAEGSSNDSTFMVERALESEAEARESEKQRYLQLAIQADPDNSIARGLLGQVQINGKWSTPAEQIAQEKADSERLALLAEYERRRAAAKDTVPAQWKLAIWCERNGLKAESIAHLTAVTRLDPGNKAAWERLGCRWYRGRWLNAEQIAAEEAEINAQAEADRLWHPRLIRWRSWLGDPEKQADAMAALGQIRDPRAVPTVVRVLDGTPKLQLWMAFVLAHIDGPQAAGALARLTVSGDTHAVREAAIRALRAVDPRTFVGLLINLIKEPIRYQVENGSGREEAATVHIETPDAQVDRRYVATPAPAIPGRQPGDEAIQATTAAQALTQQIGEDLAAIDQANLSTAQTNSRVLHALYQLTGGRLGPDQTAWASWWSEQLGYRYDRPRTYPKQVIVEEVAATYVPPPPPRVIYTESPVRLRSCFGAGTMVLSRSGLRPIETLEVGDQVLTQNTVTAALSFEPILRVFHNPPSRVLRIELNGNDVIIATDIHRFWLAGKGWTMAREIKPGDRLRLISGVAEVVAIGTAPRQAVYNLEVARNRDFFIGGQGALVHDNTLVAPVGLAFDSREESASVQPANRR